MEDFFRRGAVPITQLKQWKEAWFTLLQTHTDRAGRDGHPNDVDEPEHAAEPGAAVALVDRDTGEFLGTEDEFYSFDD